MKSVIAWIKLHVAIVALLAVIVVTLPAAYIGSSMWNRQIRTSRQAEAAKAITDIGSLRVTYTIPAALPGGEAITVSSHAPNPALTEYFREHRQRHEEQIGRVVTTAQEVNSQGHKPLVEGVFPAPTSRLKTLELVETIVGKDGRPSAYKELFRSINAGRPADPVQMHTVLQEQRERTMERLQAETGRTEMTDEEKADLAKELSSLRLGYYQQHARAISVYADPDVLPPEVPTTLGEPPTVDASFRMQFDYWTIADLLRAVDNANTVEGARTGVDQSVVKRIESITLESLIPRSSGGGDFGETPQAPRNPITGRSGGPSNNLYDIRNARMTLIVSSAHLQDLINAISRTNFMTVIGLEFEEIDPWSHLELGYYYGTDHVVRATVRVETVWLRNWTKPLMPPQIRLALTGSEEMPEEPGPG